MKENYINIIKAHLVDSYFSELFSILLNNYESKPLLPYNNHNDIIKDYQNFQEHKEYDSYWCWFKDIIEMICSFVWSILTINVPCFIIGSIISVSCILALVGSFLLGIKFILFDIIYRGIFKGAFLYDIQYYINDQNIFRYIKEVFLAPIFAVIFPFLIPGLIALVMYISDKHSIKKENNEIDNINGQIQQRNKEKYKQNLEAQFINIFSKSLTNNNEQYISNVMLQLQNNKKYFDNAANYNKTGSDFEKDCIDFINMKLKELSIWKPNEKISYRLLLFSRLYQIINENDIESFDDILRLYNSYEEEKIFLPIECIIYRESYSPEYYPLIAHQLIGEKNYIIEAINNQKSFVTHSNNIVLDEYNQFKAN